MKTLSSISIVIFFVLFISSCKKDDPVPPVLSTTSISAITTTTAISGGNVKDDGGAPVIARGICWDTSDEPDISNNKTNDNSGTGSYTSNIIQLIPNTTYYVRAYATNSSGTGYGSSVSFKTLGGKPASGSPNATEVHTTSASLSGNVNPNSLPTTVTFEYGLTTEYGSNVTPAESPISGDTNMNLLVDLTGLNPGKLYHFRIRAENSLGITYSEDMTFTTLGQVPTSITHNATNVQVRTAKLNGSVNPNDFPSTYSFEWGTTTGYGNSTATSQTPLTGNSAVDVTADLSELIPGTTYHFRIKAENLLGTSYSSDMTFTTLGQVPSVTTFDATNISTASAKLNGSVNPNFLTTTVVFEWGIDYGYGNTITPTQNTITGSTSVAISADVSGLLEGTKYYYRIVSTNELGTTKSIGFTFTTLSKPNVTTKYVSGITTTSAQSGGNIISDFGSPVSESGICWSSSHNPMISDNKVLNNMQTADFNVPIVGLTPNTTYYLRAYAINGVGIGYGNELILKTYTGMISDIDGNQYYTVTIGTQIWMAENLKTTKHQNGSLVETTTPAQLDITSESNPKYQWAPGADESNVPTYGRLYTWFAISDSRRICPLNWHIPTSAEWDIASNFLGGASVAGAKMREAGLLHYSAQNSEATNESGFTALPAGYRNQEGYFGGIYGSAGFWTFTERSSTEAYTKHLDAGGTSIGIWSYFTKNFGLSVRCVKD